MVVDIGSQSEKLPHEMLFSDFASSVRPNAAINKLPPVGGGKGDLSYSVYMNGELAKALPLDAQDHHFKKVMVEALTEKLGLNPNSSHDNMKVAELVGVRSAWMSAVLNGSTFGLGDIPGLSDAVIADYEALSNGMTHPWIQAEIQKQKDLSVNLESVLKMAESKTNSKLTEVIPEAVTKGVVLSKDDVFTVQAAGDGTVVTHENRKLESDVAVGDDVTVTYYRGSGQIFENTQDLKVSPPYLDKRTSTLAVTISNASDASSKVVLFNGVSPFQKFVDAHALPKALVPQAIEIQFEAEKIRAEKLAAEPKFVERVTPFVEQTARKHGLVIDREKIAEALVGNGPESGTFIGKIVEVNNDLGLIFQSTGRGKGALHVAENLSRVPQLGEVATISFQGGRGSVQDKQQDKERGR